MVRRPFDPEKATPQQDMALRAVDAAKAALEKSQENFWKAIEAARSEKIPNPYLNQRAGIGRSTIYRKLPASGSADGAKSDAQ